MPAEIPKHRKSPSRLVPRPDLVRGEEVIMADGQLGGEELDRGPEKRNPEGTSDLPNPRPEDL